MPRAGTAARKREREGKSPGRPGKKPWVHGTKLVFFQARVNAYLAAAEIKGTGAFYEKVAHEYLAKYGYNIPWTEDLPSGQDVADDVDEDEDVNELPADEAEERANYFKVLKTKIGAWYNGRYGGSVEGKKKKVSFKTLFDKPELNPPAPAKPRVVHFYSRRFYHERVKDHVTARWAALGRLEKRPKEITVRNAVTKECWEAEPEAFKKEVKDALESEHKAAKEAYAIATSGESPKTPEEYDIALNNAAYYLQPFADAAHERFGMNVAILLCGPIADRGGRIEMRSVHAGQTNGLVPRVWSDFDRGGFNAAQRSFVQFSHECFTEAECRARSLNGMPMAEKDADEESSALRPPPPAPATPARASPGASTHPMTPSTPTPTRTTPTPTPTRAPLPPSPPLPKSPLLQPDALGKDLLDAAVRQGQLLTFDDEAPRDLFLDPKFPLDFPPQPDEEIDFNLMMPSDFWMVEPKMGRALRAELAELSAEDYVEMMCKLRAMTEAEIENQNEMARGRLLFARMGRGLAPEVCFELSSDPEDGADLPGGENEGVAGRQKMTRAQAASMAPPPPPPPQVTSTTPAASTTHPASTTPLAPPPPPPPQVTSTTVPQTAPAVSTTHPASTTPPQTTQTAPVARPRPRPRPRVKLVRPEENREAEGPLQDPGVHDPALERPEVNREAEGPLGRPQGSAALTDTAPTWNSVPRGEETRVQGSSEGDAGGNNVRGGERAWCDAEDKDNWTSELRNAFDGFARGKEWGGEEWAKCVRLLVEFERKTGFHDKGMLKAPYSKKDRPIEVEVFMSVARHWENRFPLKTEVGSREIEGGFAERWWKWWGIGQPAARVEDGKWLAPEDVEDDEWEDMRKRYGRNGMLLYVGGLFWWGEAAAEDEERASELLAEWRVAVEDVRRVLAVVVKGVGPRPAPAKGKGNTKKKAQAPSDAEAAPATRTTRAKRKEVDTPTDAEKENAKPRKRRRTSARK